MGHKRTIRPNAKRLSALFTARDGMDWDTFAKKVKASQRGFMGEPDEMRPGRGEFHEYPSSCICEKPFSDDENSKDEKYLSNFSKAKLRSKYVEDNQGEKSLQRMKERIKGAEPASLRETKDDQKSPD